MRLTTPVLPADNIFDANDPDTYSANSSVTIFDSAGNPQSATVFYLKTQNATDADPTFKYDTKLIVDGLEITPKLTRAVDPQEARYLSISLVNRRLYPKTRRTF